VELVFFASLKLARLVARTAVVQTRNAAKRRHLATLTSVELVSCGFPRNHAARLSVSRVSAAHEKQSALTFNVAKVS
jgi:hypothetical protein